MNSQSLRVGRNTAAGSTPTDDSHRLRPALQGLPHQQPQNLWRGMGDAWAAVSTLFSGIIVWGGIGWGIDYLAGTEPIGFVVGALVGNFAAIYLIYAKELKGSTDAS